LNYSSIANNASQSVVSQENELVIAGLLAIIIQIAII
jgi:hypothetical protein